MILQLEHKPLSIQAFERISKYVRDSFGVNLTAVKRNLVENRLAKRVRQLGFQDLDEYINYAFSPMGKMELALMSDYLSTNKTYFYRESPHFEFLKDYFQKTELKNINIWSAACSYGDEVYTINALANYIKVKNHKPFQVSILGTDISSKVLDNAKKAEYPQDRIKTLPGYLLKPYFQSDHSVKDKKVFKPTPEIQRDVQFRKLNLINEIPHVGKKFDIIFCRNVLIYFQQETKEKVVKQLIDQLKPGGYLFLSLCESMLGRTANVKQIQPSVFQKL